MMLNASCSSVSILQIAGLTLISIFSFVNHITLSSRTLRTNQAIEDLRTSFYMKPFGNSTEPFLLADVDPLLNPSEWDMSPVVIEEYKLIFFTQPKIACTVFKQLFRRMTGQSDWMLENCCGKLPWNPATNGLTYLYHYNASTASHMLQDPTYTKAIFVRDPITRFLSAYLDKAVRNPFFLHQKCPDQYQLSKGTLSTEEFYALAQRCDNPHWRSQVRRLPQPSYWQFINFVGYLENAREDSERLLRKIGAWESFGASGWGAAGQALFEGVTGRGHATSAETKRKEHIRPELERMLRTEFYGEDYRHPLFARYNTLIE